MRQINIGWNRRASRHGDGARLYLQTVCRPREATPSMETGHRSIQPGEPVDQTHSHARADPEATKPKATERKNPGTQPTQSLTAHDRDSHPTILNTKTGDQQLIFTIPVQICRRIIFIIGKSFYCSGQLLLKRNESISKESSHFDT